jgi:hypothetical protein
MPTEDRTEISQFESSPVHASNFPDQVSSTISVGSSDTPVLIGFSCTDFRSNRFHFKIDLIHIGRSWMSDRVPKISCCELMRSSYGVV